MLRAVLVFYCCIKNYLKFSSLKQHTFITSQFCVSAIWQASAGYSAPGLTEVISRYWLAMSSGSLTRQRCTSTLPQLTDRIHLLAAVKLRFPIYFFPLVSCWLGTSAPRGHAQVFFMWPYSLNGTFLFF